MTVAPSTRTAVRWVRSETVYERPPTALDPSPFLPGETDARDY